MGQHKRSKSGSTPYHSATEDDDDDEGCTHTRNYCKVSNLKNKLPHAKPHCGVCCPDERKSHKRSGSAASTASDHGGDVHDLMVCLKCADVLCGQGDGAAEDHARNHFEKKRHNVFCNPSSLICWCYACDREVPADHTQPVGECVAALRKLYSVRLGILGDDAGTQGSPVGTADLGRTSKDARHFVSSFRNAARSQTWDGKIKGIVNLGNTCFVGSVLQCLARTVPLCENNAEIGRTLSEPSRVLSAKEQAPQALSVHLNEQLGPLTDEFVKFLETMNNGDQTVAALDPKSLLDEFSRRYARFRDYHEQQDSQELLRTMLDGLEEEEEERARVAIFEHFGLGCTRTSDPEFKELDASKQDEIRSYIHGYIPRVSRVFRGTLKSSVTCRVCDNKSAVLEDFLDVSVPIHTGGPPKPRGSTNSSRFFSASKKRNVKTSKTEKKQIRAARKAEQAERRRQQKGKKKGNRRSADPPPGDYDTDSATSGHSRNPSGSSVHELLGELANGNITFPAGGDLTVPGGDPTVPDAPAEDAGSTPLTPPGGAGAAAATALDGAGGANGADEPVSLPVDEPDPAEAPSPSSSPVDAKPPQVPDPADLEHKSSYVPKEGECSVQASLSALFREEILDGEDAFACEACFKAKRPASAPAGTSVGHSLGDSANGGDAQNDSPADEGGSDGGDSAGTVMQTATKRLAIQSTPEVLTIHLKRFEQHGVRLNKVLKHVSFPRILDLDAFCDEHASRSVYDDGEIGIRYELYAVVEHHGKLDSGHYTAFIKDTLIKTDGTPNKWWHISDDVSRPSSEADVLRAQAYLLFYERLY